MTNQQLKAHCEDVIANPQDHLDWVVDMARVALASLEAVPVVKVTEWMPLGIDGGVSKFLQPVGNLPDFGAFLYTSPPMPEMGPIDFEEDEEVFEKGVNALIDCLEDCGDAEQGLRLALRAMTGVE